MLDHTSKTQPHTTKRRARDSNPHEPRGPVDFKSTALPVRTSPPRHQRKNSHGMQQSLSRGLRKIAVTFGQLLKSSIASSSILVVLSASVNISFMGTRRDPPCLV